MNELLYIIEAKNKIKVMSKEEKYLDMKIDTYIEKLCLSYFSTLKGRMDAYKKVFGYCYNAPIFISDDLILMKVKGVKKGYVNIVRIDKIYNFENKTKIVFDNGLFLIVNCNYTSINKNYKRIYKNFRSVKKI